MATNLSAGTPTNPNPSQKVMTGGRAQVYINNQLVGIFESANYNVAFGTEAIHLLGRFSPDEITLTSYEAVTISCSGFRVVGNGPTVLPAVPLLADLLALEAATITIVDRQTGEAILTAIGCVPTAYNGNHNSRATSRITINYTGIAITDESSDGDSEIAATSLP